MEMLARPEMLVLPDGVDLAELARARAALEAVVAHMAAAAEAAVV